ncbi:hypothetical protein AVEN_71036-1 [Araneus ventricosus]|uniref:Uncharacterized protein n=1 Tax=Araneus ventricosus TaxID=182803 RepID=A0A4Y2IHI2_ARAVE|nr:hypothetical protein AVEN_71036-1 [Araneus ventricosus]
MDLFWRITLRAAHATTSRFTGVRPIIGDEPKNTTIISIPHQEARLCFLVGLPDLYGRFSSQNLRNPLKREYCKETTLHFFNSSFEDDPPINAQHLLDDDADWLKIMKFEAPELAQ